MPKKILLMLHILILIVCLSACGKPAEPGQSGSENKSEAEQLLDIGTTAVSGLGKTEAEDNAEPDKVKKAEIDGVYFRIKENTAVIHTDESI